MRDLSIIDVTDDISISLRTSSKITILVDSKSGLAGAVLTKDSAQNLISELEKMVKEKNK